jgi:hypothetical protein
VCLSCAGGGGVKKKKQKPKKKPNNQKKDQIKLDVAGFGKMVKPIQAGTILEIEVRKI